VARAKPPENITSRSEGKKAEAAPRTEEAAPPAKPVVGSGWILAATLWLVLFLVLILYEGYGFLKGILRL
jgi:hypothetical protein